MARLSLFLLGSFQVILDGTPVTEFRSDKTRALLAYLALEAGRPHRRDTLTGLLWPDVPDRAARNSLRQSLHRLRQAIGDTDAPPDFLHVTGESVQFNSAADIWLDVTAFDALLTTVESHFHRRVEVCAPCVTQLREAADLYRGDFLQGFILEDSVAFSEWVAVRREWLHRRALEALFHLAEYHRWRGEYEPASKHARRQLELEPWREEAHRQLMSLLARHGERSAALAQYETCRRILKQELSVEPSTETVDLYERIRRSTAGRRHNLPPQPTPFIGRQVELAEIAGRLADPDCRLLTLVGPGGIGKSRLALQAAENQLGSYLHGVYLVPLAGVGAVDVVPAAIVTALGHKLYDTAEPRRQFLDCVREKEMLLVLDNFEHLLEGTTLLTDALEVAPYVKLLVTSRERLNVQSEWLLSVEGLSFPETETAQGIERYSSVALFVQTVRRVQANLTLDETELPFVARICRLVEGLPLALEMAASWTRTLACRDIAREIEQGISILTASARDVAERHRSIHAVFDHSWKLLLEAERVVLRQLSVFRGGFTREAAERVTGVSPLILSSLVDKSLLRLDSRPGDTPRFDLHELVRQYANNRLVEAGQDEQTRDQHLGFFLRVAEDVEPQLRGASQSMWLERLEREQNNLRAALDWSLARGAAGSALQLAVTLTQSWFLHGYLLLEGIEWLENILLQAEAREPMQLRAKAFLWLGTLAQFRGDYARARSAYEQSISLFRDLGDKHGLAESLQSLADIVADQGDDAAARVLYATARTAFEENLARSQQLGDQWNIASTLNSLGELARLEGDYPAARSFYEESLFIRSELGDQRGIGVSTNNLGFVAQYQGDYKQAAAFFHESLLLFQKHEWKRGIFCSLEGLAGVARGKGRMERAARLFGAAEALHTAIGTRLDYADQIQHDRNVIAVRAQLDETTFNAAWTAGRSMTLEEAIDYALESNIF
jgi:predicted ATPase/DNA-binding SARP family transcriptional activator